MYVYFESDFPATDQQRDLVLRRARAATRRTGGRRNDWGVQRLAAIIRFFTTNSPR
jgi:hypothetical protein